MAGRKKGTPKTGGRVKGKPNTELMSVRKVFEIAFAEMQEDPNANLLSWGKENATEFYKLSSKLLPLQITGDPNAPLTIQVTGMVIK